MNACSKKNALICLAGFTLAALAGTAQGQFTEEYASGFLHTRLGVATLGPVDGRRLPVHNLGSSGQDGVEIKWNSMWGGGAGVSVPGLFGGGGGAGGSFRTKYKGWDGTIKGNMRVASGPAGMVLTVDFSALGAVGVEEIVRDSSGAIISDTMHGSSSVDSVINPECPPPQVPTMWYWRLWDSNLHKYVYQWMWTCMDHVTLNGNHLQDARTYIPILPPGVTDDDGLDSVLFQTSLPNFDVLDSQILTFGASLSGKVNAIAGEQCDAGGTCGLNERKLVVSNIGSSGQDGVEIDLGLSSASGSVSYRRGSGGWDMKELKKFYDDQGVRMLQVSHQPSPGTSDSALTFDFSTIGDGSCYIEFFDGNHNPLGSDFFVANSGGTVVLDPAWRCFPPMTAQYGWDYVNQKWIFLGCHGGFDMVLPSGGMVSGAVSMEITPTQTSLHRLRSAEITGSDSQGDIIVEGVSQTGCPADVTHDDVIDLSDFFQFLNDFDQTMPGADIDGNPGVDLGDFFTFLNSFDQGC